MTQTEVSRLNHLSPRIQSRNLPAREHRKMRKIQAANERVRSIRSGEQSLGTQMIGSRGGYAGGNDMTQTEVSRLNHLSPRIQSRNLPAREHRKMAAPVGEA
jgi:hypothetical protein